MRHFSIWCVGLGLAALTTTLTAQSGAGHPADSAAVPLELGSGDGSHAVAQDSSEGSIVIGGQRTTRHKVCPMASRALTSTAFISKWSEDGRELWHRDSESLFASLQGLDPRYLLASTVHGLAVDPFTDEIFAVGEALVGWRGTSCESGGATARGTFVLRLTEDGTLLHDAYLGVVPDGPPLSASECGGLCPPDRGLELVGQDVTVGADGEVVVTGWRQEASAARDARRRVFVTRLSHDLVPETEEPYSAPGGAVSKMLPGPNVICGNDPGDVLSVTPLGETSMSPAINPERAVAYMDTCKLRISGGGEDYGIDIELSLGMLIPANLHLNLKLQYLGEASRMDVLFFSDGEFIQQQVLEFGEEETIQTQIPVPSAYILPGNRLVVRLLNREPHAMSVGSNCEDDYEIDWGDS